MRRTISAATIATLSMIAASLVPASTVGATTGENEDEAPVVNETTTVPDGHRNDDSSGAAEIGTSEDGVPSATGELLVDGGIVTSLYQGNRITVSADMNADWSWINLSQDELVAARTLIGDDSANGKRAASAEIGVHYLTLIGSDGFSVLIEVTSNDSDGVYTFDIGLPNGARLVLTDEGSVDVLGDNRYTLGTFETPWALDANGNNVPTQFKVDGNSITQTIETDENTIYPVVADPKFTWGWVTGTVYFNKWETMTLCSASLYTLQGLVVVPFWLPIITAVAASLFVISCIGRLTDMCVKVKSTRQILYYTGGYCTW